MSIKFMLKKRTQQAFTLLELMVTLSIFAILVGFAVPSFNKQISSSRSNALAEDFLSAFNYARTQSVALGKKVTVCAANATATDCSTNWNAGWIVFIDSAASDTTKPPLISKPADILRKWGSLGSSKASIVFTPSRTVVRFTSFGVLAATETTIPVDLTVKYTDCVGSNARRIQVSASGVITSAAAACL
jgi:type IV fimbrial biogenesis protein FimT